MSSHLSPLETALRGLGIDPQAELERYHRACRSASIVPITPPPPPTALPEDYLASSEKLLESLAASPPPHQAPRRRPGPFAIAGVAMTAAAIGIFILGLRRQPVTPIATAPHPEDNATTTTAAIPVPYLASGVDVPLNVATLAQIEPTAATAANVKNDEPAIIAATPDLSADFFYVTLEYSSARLEQVRQRIPDALVVKFPAGNRIQVGAFYRQDQAERMAQQLQKDNLPASVYRPE